MGTGMMISAEFKIKGAKCRTLGIEEAEQIGKEHNCDLWAQEDKIKIQTNRILALNYNEALQLGDFLDLVKKLNSITEAD